jgi:hypothetical protein
LRFGKEGTSLLIHSLAEFSDLIIDSLGLAGSRTVVEIGAEYGGMSDHLVRYCRARRGQLISIDPAAKPDFCGWLQNNPDVRHLAVSSLEAFDRLANVDAWLVDGDHNWYTVYHELRNIEAISRRDGRPVLAFVHDVGWPCGRRDLYYAPDLIPPAFRHPFSFSAGATPGRSPLIEDGGFRGAGRFAFAQHEGGPRNGVLTAIDDFLAEELVRGRQYGIVEIPAVFGLAVVFDLDAPWSGPLADLLLPYHDNKLLRALEHNRLRNYLRVIEYQDEAAGRDRRSGT